MTFAALVGLAATLPYFDLPTLVQAFDDPREVIRVQLSRWMAQGLVVPLRRGAYTLGDTYRRAPVTPAFLANQLYRPSYLSGVWALSFYGLIPDAVVWLTSVTTRGPRRFENPVGLFEYRHLKPTGFFGYEEVRLAGAPILVASPEKALVDDWHLSHGEWTTARLAEMRYQHTDSIDAGRLRTFAGRFESPRLIRAAERWIALMTHQRDADQPGTVTL